MLTDMFVLYVEQTWTVRKFNTDLDTLAIIATQTLFCKRWWKL